MKETNGDLWAVKADARCITTNSVIRKNGCLVMGAGVAKQALIRYPDVDRRFGDLVKLFGNIPFFLTDHSLMSFPTKNSWKHKSSLELIEASAQRAVFLADQHGLAVVALTRPGCGLGGLAWEDVEPLLAGILDDRFVVVS